MSSLYHNKSKLKSLDIISLLSACIVPLMITGPFLPDLLLSVLSLWFLYYSLKNKIYTIYFNLYFYIFIFFCLICILSSFLSDDIFLSLESSLFYFRIGIFALLISFLIDYKKIILNYFYYSFVVTFVFLIIDGFTQYFTGWNLFGFQLQGVRVSSVFGQELILGSYLSRLFPLFFALFIFREKKHYLELCFVSILFILIEVLIFLSGERAAFVLFNLSTIFIILFIHKYKLLRLSIFIISSTVIIILLMNNSKLYDRYITSVGINLDSKKDIIVNIDNQTKSNFIYFTPAHDSLFRTAWNMFLDKPILGHGPKLYRVKCKNPKYAIGVSPCHTHPHNFYIQLLAETGLIGFSFLAGLLIYFIYIILRHTIIYLLYRQRWLSDYQICLLAGLLITIWPLTTNGNIFSNKLMIFYGLQMGFFRNIKRIKTIDEFK
jgi:O-antigen ligase